MQASGDRRLIRIFLLLATVALLGDFTYEGARSFSGAFLGFLGAPVLAVGLLGLGELVMHVSRVLAGVLIIFRASRRVFWATLVLGYIVNLCVIPLLALVDRWWEALAIYIIERAGKGIRGPARDSLVSKLTEPLGRGKGFGIYELLDQIGAVTGPIALSLGIRGLGISNAFLILSPTAALAVILVVIVLWMCRGIPVEGVGKPRVHFNFVSKELLLSVGLAAAGSLQWPLISYHLLANNIVQDYRVPLLYMLVMLSDALVALPLGLLYDKVRTRTLLLLPLLGLTCSVLIVMVRSAYLIVLTCLLMGVFFSCFETIVKAAVADVYAGNELRGYGALAITLSIAWSAGGLATATLYMFSLKSLLLYIAVVQLACFNAVYKLCNKTKNVSQE